MNIPKANAKPLIDDYIANGDSTHFDYDRKMIKGFRFTRKDIMKLINSSKHLFAMWGLSTSPFPGEGKHLNLILGGVATDNSQHGLGDLDLSKLEITSIPVYNSSITLKNGTVIKSTGMNESDKGDRPLPAVLRAMIEDFKKANNSHLRDRNGKKIQGYHIEDDDLRDLTLRDPMTSANELDEFIFIPVIRKDKLPALNFDSPFLSVAISRYHNKKLLGFVREYCLPCPTACPNNFPIQ